MPAPAVFAVHLSVSLPVISMLIARSALVSFPVSLSGNLYVTFSI